MIKKKETALRAIENGIPKVNQWSEELLCDEELLVMAVSACGEALKDVPKNLRTARICRAAFHKNPKVISDVPDKNYIREEELIEAIRKGRLKLTDFSHSDKRKTLAVCAEAALKSGEWISFWHLHSIPEEVLMNAIKTAYEHSFDDDITDEYDTYETMEDSMSSEYDEYKVKHIVGSVYRVDGERYHGHPEDHRYWDGAHEYVRIKSA